MSAGYFSGVALVIFVLFRVHSLSHSTTQDWCHSGKMHKLSVAVETQARARKMGCNLILAFFPAKLVGSLKHIQLLKQESPQCQVTSRCLIFAMRQATGVQEWGKKPLLDPWAPAPGSFGQKLAGPKCTQDQPQRAFLAVWNIKVNKCCKYCYLQILRHNPQN